MRNCSACWVSRKISVWRFQEAERHFVQAEALYAARGDTGAVQSMTARRGQAMIALGRLQECAAIVEALQRVPLIEVEARLIAATVTMWLHLERGESRAVAPAFEKLVQLLQSCKTVGEWNIIPPPRQTACPGMAGPMLRWGTGALAMIGDGPYPLRAMAQVALAWRAVWLGQLQEAADLHAAGVADAQWAGHEVILRSHSIALRALLALLRGDNTEALQCARTRIEEHPAGYGDWGLWHVLYFSARIAAAAGDAPVLRDWLQRLLALQARLTEADPQRLRPTAGLQGALAELEGRRDEALAHWREVLAHEEAADLVAQAGEVRVRLASIALKNGAREEAAALIRPLLQKADDGPRGAVFAVAALGELARADWSGHLDAAESATLRAWATSLARTPESVGPVAAPDAALSVVEATTERLTPREIEVLARIAAGDSNKLIARAFDLSLHTVKRHVAHILDKLDLESRGQAAAWYRARFASGFRLRESLMSTPAAAARERGRTWPVSSSVLRFERTIGQPPDMPASIFGSRSRSSWLTVKRTRPSPCGSISNVTRECFESSSASLGRAHVITRRRGGLLSTTLPTMSTMSEPSERWCSHREPGFQSDTFTREHSPLEPTQYWRATSGSASACHTFCGVVAM